MNDDWFERAACRDAKTSVFFPSTNSKDPFGLKIIQRYCDKCSVTAECDAFATEINARTGIWGGKLRRRNNKHGTEEP